MNKTWEYTLTGFGDSLERRRIAFLDPLPKPNVCSVCGMVSSNIWILPCGHSLCEFCEEQVENPPTCPKDYYDYVRDELTSVNFTLEDIGERRVLCAVAGAKCDFDGTLHDMLSHIIDCTANENACAKCGRSVVREDAFDHYLECSGSDSTSARGPDIAVPSTALETLEALKKDLGTLRECASSALLEQATSYVEAANSLVEHVTELESELLRMEDLVAGQDSEATIRASKVPNPSGPYRAASKPGVFIATTAFSDAHSISSLDGGKQTEMDIVTGPCTLAGYTFQVKCHAERSEAGEVRLQFVFFLESGEWDDSLEWPFAKKVSMVLSHPVDAKKDIRLPLTEAEREGSGRKPVPGVPNNGYATVDIPWKRVLDQGFICMGKLYVNVEFE